MAFRLARLFTLIAWIFELSLISSYSSTPASTVKKPLYIGVMVPFSTEGPSGIDLIETVKLALSDINSNQTILNDYELKAEIGFSKFKPASAINVFINMVTQKTIKVGIIGAQNSRCSEYVASAATSWNLAQISHGSTSTILSNKIQFPYFFRTALSDISYNLARVAFSLHFNWTKVAVLYQIATAYTAAANDLVSDFKNKNISDVYAEGVLDQFAVVVGNMKAKDMRIIYAIGQAPVIIHVLCEAYKQKLYGPKYVWILVGWYPNNWWEVEMQPSTKCTPAQIYQVIQNYFYVYRSYPQTSNATTISGRSPYDFNQQFLHLPNVTATNTLRAYMYDAVWTMAHALDKTEKILLPQNKSLSQFNYSRSDIRSVIVNQIANTSILGITGSIKFFGADRLGDVYIFQFQGEKSKNKTVPVGLYKASTDDIVFSSDYQIVWPNGQPPLSQSVIVERTLHISLGLAIAYMILAAIGMLAALVFLIFNLYYQSQKQIKMLSPRMNALFAAGCCICYAAVILMAIDINLTIVPIINILCQANVWFLCLGFTLAFGSLFSKMWRVYRVFAIKSVKRVIVKDWHLAAVVLQLALIDIILLTIWTIVDPLQTGIISSSTQQPNSDVILRQTSYICTCKNVAVWLGLICSYKFLVLIFGTFLAYETRKVTISVLNDSKFIGFSIYNITVFCIIGAVTAFLTGSQPTMQFALLGGFILFCTSITMTMVFKPQISLYKNRNRWGRRKIGDQPDLFADDTHRGVGLDSTGTTFTTIESARSALQNAYKNFHKMDEEIKIIKAKLAEFESQS